MKVELVPVDLKLPEPVQPRSKGIHVSGLIRCIALETGLLDATYAENMSLTDVREITDPIAILRISLGLAWEEWFIPQLPDVVDHPGEMQVEGIYLTHDGESLDTVMLQHQLLLKPVVHEVKLTWKSTKTVGNLENQWLWLCQLKAYCYALGTRWAKFYVYFVCGDYAFPITPQLRCWSVEFTQEEVDSNWALLKEYKLHRKQTDGVQP